MENFKIKIPNYSIGQKRILTSISFSVNEKNILAIVGPNGGGKTSLLNLILRPPKIKNLEIAVGNIDLCGLSAAKKSRFISHLGSSDFSQPAITLSKFVENAAYLSKIEEEKIKNLLDNWKISNLADEYVKNLSQGQFQRLLLLTTFNQESKIYILDEPERHLDPDGIQVLQQNVLEAKSLGKSLMFVTHDLNLALSVADVIVGISKNGSQEFYAETKLVIERKLIDSLFEANFKYVDVGSNKTQVFV